MKIIRITATEVRVPAKPNAVNSPTLDRPLHKLPVAGQKGWSMQFDELPKLILEIALDNGVVGLGECYRNHDWAVVEAVAQQLIGQSVRDLNRQELPIGLTREYDGFECALWDAFAKSHHLRLVDLLGGPVRGHVTVGAWTGHRTMDEIGTIAHQFAEQGYTCYKLKCDLEDDVIGWCKEVARAAPKMRVILDPNERWENAHEAKQRIKGLMEVGNVLCLEDPIPRWMLAEYHDLRQFGNIPIVLHVSLPYILHGQRVHDAVLALQQRAVDGFNFNSGLVKFQQLDHIAAAANLPCWHGSEVDLGILEAMYVHQAAAATSCVWPSDIFGRLVREHDLLQTPLEFTPPTVKLPDGDGLGVTLDRDALAHYQTQQRVFA